VGTARRRSGKSLNHLLPKALAAALASAGNPAASHAMLYMPPVGEATAIRRRKFVRERSSVAVDPISEHTATGNICSYIAVWGPMLCRLILSLECSIGTQTSGPGRSP